ncbi:hypothetical protein PENDEC_c014G00402 [Penicillium decumbens]|uniref:Hydrophobin n=1 Tax=Penicillium decumbens TaxID=69771 RepID=A0A1V6P9I1_PENDC|nr:hypothetical protein PENDEC_c014G00402 [Penicillium decumbens]
MKYLLAYSALFAAVLASPPSDSSLGKKTCEGDQTVVCSDNGNGGLLSLGNILSGLLGESCSGGDVYCCDSGAVKQTGLINLDLNLQCTLNHVL